MAENLKSDSGVLAKASQTVDTHRAEQNAIGQRVQAAAAESQSGWQGQGAAAVAQVVSSTVRTTVGSTRRWPSSRTP